MAHIRGEIGKSRVEVPAIPYPFVEDARRVGMAQVVQARTFSPAAVRNTSRERRAFWKSVYAVPAL